MSSDSSQPESSNFDNDFEKLDPLTSQMDDLVTSTSEVQGDMAEADLYSRPPASEVEPLVNLMEEPAPPARQPDPQPLQPDSSSPSKPAATEGKTCCAGTWMKQVDPRVIELIYWRDVKKSGIVFGSMMVLLLSLALFSVLSVVSYLSLGVLTITISFVIYKKVIGAVQKSSDGHPFKEYLDLNIALPEDKARELADLIIGHVSCCLRELRRLFLIEDMVDSLKFGLMLWVLTYVGAWFNGMTLIILATVKLFTLPKVYEMHQEQIDHYIDLAKVQTKAILKQVQEKLPLPGKKKQT